MTKFSSTLEWLYPYIKLAGKFGIPVHRLKKVNGYHVPKRRYEQQYGSCERLGNGFIINLIDAYQLRKKGKVVGYIPCDHGHLYEHTLLVLAHELSHMVQWSHNADRLILEAKLYLAFAKLAKKNNYRGYKS